MGNIYYLFLMVLRIGLTYAFGSTIALNRRFWQPPPFHLGKCGSILRNCKRNRNLRISRAPLKSQVHQDTSLLRTAMTTQRVFSKG